MVATNVKGETFSLIDKRAAMEAEMNAIIERLNQPGGLELSGYLVDSESWIKCFTLLITEKRSVKHRIEEGGSGESVS